MSHNTHMSTIQSVIKSFRERKGLSVQAFSNLAGVSPSTYYYVMLEKKQVGYPKVLKMLEACGYTLTPTPISEVETPNEQEGVLHV